MDINCQCVIHSPRDYPPNRYIDRASCYHDVGRTRFSDGNPTALEHMDFDDGHNDGRSNNDPPPSNDIHTCANFADLHAGNSFHCGA